MENQIDTQIEHSVEELNKLLAIKAYKELKWSDLNFSKVISNQHGYEYLNIYMYIKQYKNADNRIRFTMGHYKDFVKNKKNPEFKERVLARMKDKIRMKYDLF